MEITQERLLNRVATGTLGIDGGLRAIEHSELVSEDYRASHRYTKPPNQPFEKVLQTIFPSKQEETQLQKARRIMGCATDDLSDEELKTAITEFQYLLNEWMYEFERKYIQ